jgi:thiol:disulfide interchange protein DsbD
MYGTAAWLTWVFTLQAGTTALPFLFAAGLFIAFAAWAWGVAQRADKPMVSRTVAVVALVAAIPLTVVGARMSAGPASAATTTAQAGAALPTEPWSPEKVAMLRAQGKPVFVDFTAAWCVTCQVNERTALAGKRVAEAFAKTGAVYLKADWTNRDAAIAKALSDRGRSGVPLYLVYGPTGEPAVLPQLLSEGVVVAALDKAKAINDVAQTIINSAKAETEHCRVTQQVPGSGFVGSEAPSATRRSASKSADGRSRPRFSARRRIPAHALGLKK